VAQDEGSEKKQKQEWTARTPRAVEKPRSSKKKRIRMTEAKKGENVKPSAEKMEQAVIKKGGFKAE